MGRNRARGAVVRPGFATQAAAWKWIDDRSEFDREAGGCAPARPDGVLASMSSYRPICDTWYLARAKLKGGARFYGAYLGGFPERARALLGVNIYDPVLHVCGGMARLYPYKGGFGPNDATLDLDPATRPDFLQDARDPYPSGESRAWGGFRAVLADPPYSIEDAGQYVPGRAAYPSPVKIVANALAMLPPGGRVGIIHYMIPKPPAGARFIASVGVLCGFNNRIRVYSVFEKETQL
jgi:hypothetical protein